MSGCTNGDAGGAPDREEREARRRQKALELGTRVKGLRGFRRYSQGRLSAITGLSRNYLSELELGRRPRPRPETLERLAFALGVTVDQLRGKAPMPEELGQPDRRREPEPERAENPPGPPAPRAPTAQERSQALRAAFAFAGVLPDSLGTLRDLPALLEAMPPGVLVSYQQFPDGSMLVVMRLPPRDDPPALDPPGT